MSPMARRSFFGLRAIPNLGSPLSPLPMSIARKCKDEGILWAKFFINRSNINTTDPNSYFPSVARQLAERSGFVEGELHDALKKQPSLMGGISVDQAAGLFVDAMGVASSLDHSKAVIVIISGLDETDRKRLRHTADVFSKLLTSLPAKVLPVVPRTKYKNRLPGP